MVKYTTSLPCKGLCKTYSKNDVLKIIIFEKHIDLQSPTIYVDKHVFEEKIHIFQKVVQIVCM